MSSLTPNQRTALAAHVAATPSLSAIRAAGDLPALVAALNAPDATETRWQPVPRKTFVAWCMRTGLWTSLRGVALFSPTEENRALIAAALTVLDLAGDTLDWLDTRLPVIQQMAGGFQQAGLLTSDQAAEMLALGFRPATVAEVMLEADGVTITEDDGKELLRG